MKFAKLRGRIYEKYTDLKSYANSISISYVSLLNKLDGKSDFNRQEILEIISSLDIPWEDIKDYFFNE